MSIDLEAIRRRADAATSGPWGEGGATVYDEQLIPICRCMATRDRYKDERQNADFIAHAREDIPALLAEVERLTNICKAQKASCSLVKTVEAAGLKDKVEQLTAQIASVTAERDAARERLCYTCKNGNPSAGTKHSISCDVCPWRGTQKGESDETD